MRLRLPPPPAPPQAVFAWALDHGELSPGDEIHLLHVVVAEAKGDLRVGACAGPCAEG